MSRHQSTSTILLLAGIMALGLVGTPAASAKGKVPPSIDDLVGVYQATDKGVEYDLWTTDSWKYGSKGTVTITKVNATTLSIHYDMDAGWSWTDQCNYAGGGLVVSGSSDDTDLGSWAYVNMLTFSGKPGQDQGQGHVHGQRPRRRVARHVDHLAEVDEGEVRDPSAPTVRPPGPSFPAHPRAGRAFPCPPAALPPS